MNSKQAKTLRAMARSKTEGFQYAVYSRHEPHKPTVIEHGTRRAYLDMKKRYMTIPAVKDAVKVARDTLKVKRDYLSSNSF